MTARVAVLERASENHPESGARNDPELAKARHHGGQPPTGHGNSHAPLNHAMVRSGQHGGKLPAARPADFRALC